MASSTSANSSGSSEAGLQVVMDQRKRKRMESNRESARRSRMRKQKHMDELTSQVAQLMRENNQILTGINITSQHLLNVEAENSILRAQTTELSQRLQSLNEIINIIYATNGVSETEGTETCTGLGYGDDGSGGGFMNPLSMLCVNQPIMAAGAAGDVILQY